MGHRLASLLYTYLLPWKLGGNLLYGIVHFSWLEISGWNKHSAARHPTVSILSQRTTAEGLFQDDQQLPKGHGLQTRGLAGQSHS